MVASGSPSARAFLPAGGSGRAPGGVPTGSAPLGLWFRGPTRGYKRNGNTGPFRRVRIASVGLPTLSRALVFLIPSGYHERNGFDVSVTESGNEGAAT